MNHTQMAALIEERGAAKVAALLTDTPAQLKAAFADGTDVTGWECFPSKGMLLFVHRPHRVATTSDARAALRRERDAIYAALAGCDDDSPATARRYLALIDQRDAIDAALAAGEDAPVPEPDGGVLVVNCPPGDVPRYAAETADAGFPIISLSEEPAPF